MRGKDIPNNPLFFAYVLLTDSTIQLYIHQNRITEAITQHFDKEFITIIEDGYDNILNGIKQYVRKIVLQFSYEYCNVHHKSFFS